MKPQNILEQLLGPGAGQSAGRAVQNAKDGLANSGLAASVRPVSSVTTPRPL